MRLAVITDIHGNIHALEAVLRDIAAQAVDEIVIAGDTVNILLNSKACWDMVTALGCPVLKGNHEYYLYAYGTPDMTSEWMQERFKGLAWLREQFSNTDIHMVQALPMTYRLPDLLITHASPRSLFANVETDTPADKLREAFGDVGATFIVRGHNHKWYEHRWEDHTLVTVASCGLPLTGRLEAPYLLLEKRDRWHFKKRFIRYDLEAAVATMDEAYLEYYGPVGKLFKRELLTGRGHTLPILCPVSRAY
jgi:hypothetical protein